jgi:hypothetical protein
MKDLNVVNGKGWGAAANALERGSRREGNGYNADFTDNRKRGDRISWWMNR